MKKKILATLFVIITTASFLIGCGEQESESNKGNVQVSKESETQEIGIENEDSKPIEKIDWTWELSDFEMYQLMKSQGEASPSLFKGTIEYADGTEGDISADRVTLEEDTESQQILVGVWFRDDIFYYKINIQERWGDGESLSEEEVETFKQEGSSSGSTGSLTSDWSDNGIVDLNNNRGISESSLYDQVKKMVELEDLWLKAVADNNNQFEVMSNNDYKGKDTAYSYEIDVTSDWYSLYGDSNISEVFKVYNLPEYGAWGRCSCGLYSEAKDKAKSISDTAWNYISFVPLSMHTKGEMPFDELVEYIKVTYAVRNDMNMESVKKDPVYIEDFIGIGYNELLSKFRDACGEDLFYDVDLIYKTWNFACQDAGFTGTIEDWYFLDNTSIQKYVLDVAVADCSRNNWDGVQYWLADMITRLGSSIPENAILVENKTTADFNWNLSDEPLRIPDSAK